MLAQVSVPTIDELRAFLEGFVTMESRLAVTALLAIVGVTIGIYVLPFASKRMERFVTQRLLTGRVADGVEFVGEYVPRTIGDVLLRTVQLFILLGTLAGVLLVWGLTDLVVETTTYVVRSVPLLGKILLTLLVFLSTYVTFQVLRDTVYQLGDQTRWMTKHQEEILLRVSQVALIIVGTLLVMTVWQVDLGGLLVGAGFLGIVVGFAARQTLGSIIAGFLLMFSRPFTIGDWVVVGEQEGVVTDITIVNTRLENFDGETVIIPNDRVSDRPITNRSNRGGLRLKVDVGVDYAADTGRAEEVALEAMESIDVVEEGPPPQVVPKSFGDSAVVLELRFWIDNPTPPRKWQAVSEVVRTVKAHFEAADIKIPFPQRELSGRAETGGFRVHGETDGFEPDRSTQDGER